MKTTRSLLGILTITVALAAPAQGQSFLTNGLVTYYPFNGNANDASGNGNNGNLGAGIGFAPDRFGNPQSALCFTNGVAGQMTTTVLQPASNVFTIAIWFNEPIAYTNGGALYLICLTDTQTGPCTGIKIDKMLQVGGHSPNNQLSFYLYPGYAVYLPTPNPEADGQWHHAVATLSSGGMMLYLDGQLVATNANTLSDGYAGYWRILPGQGLVGDVRIYNRALSASEVQQLYAYEAVPSIPHAASATATVVNGFVVGATMTDLGGGYTNAPQVLIQGGGGTGATATAIVTNGYVVGLTITDPGSGYTNTPAIYIAPPAGFLQSASATATVVNGFVVGATMTGFGGGYTNAPQVLIQGGGGTGATATAIVTNGYVVGLTITDPGSGYTNTPTILIYPPTLNWQVGLIEEVLPTFTGLSLGADYQLQLSGNLITWTNQGSPFTATNNTMVYPQGFAVSNWNRLFFRLELAP
jgi:hypothetical protein